MQVQVLRLGIHHQPAVKSFGHKSIPSLMFNAQGSAGQEVSRRSDSMDSPHPVL